MIRSHRLFCSVLAAVVLCPTLVRAQSGVDLIPDDAAFALVINSISGVRANGAKFLSVVKRREANLAIADNDENEQRLDSATGRDRNGWRSLFALFAGGKEVYCSGNQRSLSMEF